MSPLRTLDISFCYCLGGIAAAAFAHLRGIRKLRIVGHSLHALYAARAQGLPAVPEHSFRPPGATLLVV